MSRARLVVCALLLASCRSVTPWANDAAKPELNLSFILENNLLVVPSATVNGVPARMLFGSAEARSVVDPRFAATVRAPYRLNFSEREAFRFNPVPLDLRGIADGIAGADLWGNHAISIDYHAGLITYQKEGIEPAEMMLFRYEAEPAIPVMVDGRPVTAIVDTTLPDTLVLPAASEGRRTAHVAVARTDFGVIDVGYTTTPRARIGNRLLSRFLISIHYGSRVVGLWRDPRTR